MRHKPQQLRCYTSSQTCAWRRVGKDMLPGCSLVAASQLAKPQAAATAASCALCPAHTQGPSTSTGNRPTPTHTLPAPLWDTHTLPQRHTAWRPGMLQKCEHHSCLAMHPTWLPSSTSCTVPAPRTHAHAHTSTKALHTTCTHTHTQQQFTGTPAPFCTQCPPSTSACRGSSRHCWCARPTCAACCGAAVGAGCLGAGLHSSNTAAAAPGDDGRRRKSVVSHMHELTAATQDASVSGGRAHNRTEQHRGRRTDTQLRFPRARADCCNPRCKCVRRAGTQQSTLGEASNDA